MSQPSSDNPYLSIVYAGRNDNYGGDFDRRLENSVQWLSKLCNDLQFTVELIIVNYNPVDGRPSLEEAIAWPNENKYLQVRIITVPEETHQTFVDPAIRKTVPLFEYIAKNIGIRRAKGEYIMGANPDIIFHPAIIKYIARKKLSRREYYRVDRCDYKAIEETTLENIRQNIFQIFMRQNRYQINPGEYSAWKLFKLRMYNRWRIRKDIWIRKNEKLAHKYDWDVIYDDTTMFYHTHCSGDFMLMHRDHWFALNGHPENTYLALHTDSIFVVMARHLGLKEHVFQWPIYHQDHERRYDAEAEGENQDFRAMFELLVKDSREMEKSGKPIIYNGDDWGCAGMEFAESRI